jgi:hypothetical protein
VSLAARAFVMVGISELWCSRDPLVWNEALERYWEFVARANLELERRMESLDLERIRQLDAQGWYDFLLSEYFRWKYTAPNRYASTTRSLRRYKETNALAELKRIKRRLLAFDVTDIRQGLSIAREIKGLGTAGASGLLALMYPETFATVDQFVVKGLREVEDLPEGASLTRMNPEGLSIANGVLLIGIMRRKAFENNQIFHTATWTPRKIDKILWTYGR